MTALLKEMRINASQLQEGKEIFETVYLGGGTPSLLSSEEISILLQEAGKVFAIDPSAEITLEANPDDITAEKISGWKNAGINRLSIGIQSFFDEDLAWMNRAHNAKQANSCLEIATAEFENISIDLIYGLPGLTSKKWDENVAKAISFNIPHLSCYALTVEPKTRLQKMINLKQVEDVDPEMQSIQFLWLMDRLEETGYEHYEVSNFAKPGFRSRHNSSYWSGKKYLGIGPSAHSFNGIERRWNVSNNRDYIDAVNKGLIPFEKEVLTPTQRSNEYIMTSLRTIEGLDTKLIDVEAKETLMIRCSKFIESGKMMAENGILKLTKEGILFADGIAADLFA